LTACSGSTTEPTSTSTTTDSTPEPVTLTLAAWSLDSTPEFKTLTDAFHAENPNITVELKEYDASQYDTQMIADLAAGAAPDMYILKNLKNFYTYEDGGQLLDVSDVASGYDSNTNGLPFYQVDGKTYAIPYRQDSWYLYYNKDLFDKAGMAYPDGSWTWDDWASNAEALSKALGKGVYGAYEHRWQSTTQGFANAQSPGADILTGNFDYMAPFYDRRVAMQKNGAEVDFGTSSTNNLSYQGEFGRQKAAMLIMGSWYVASYIAQQGSGDADTFNWGIAPVPQIDSSTTSNPVTFGDPTGIGINPAIDKSKVDAAKKFLAFIGGEKAAVALAGIGITPAYSSDTVTNAYFALDGVPTDDLSKFTFGHHDTKPENPVSPNTAAIQNILGDMHTAILSGDKSVKDAIAEAEKRAQDEVLNQ
jgi:multiple sugar transport system substrate-binding protein